MKIKIGDTFLLALVVRVDGLIQDLTNWQVRSCALTPFGERYPFEIEFTDRVNGAFNLMADTSSWNPGNLNFDIRYTTDSGQVITTKSVLLRVMQSDTP